ncbi:hypothetical protein Tco_0313977 [Tanacetum coccineum]
MNPIMTQKGTFLFSKQFLNSDPSPPPNQGNYLPEIRKELKLCEAKTAKSSIDEPPEVELKDLPPHLEYAFLEDNNNLPVHNCQDFSVEEKTLSIKVSKVPKDKHCLETSDIRALLNLRSKVRNNILQKLGDGEDTNVWFDNWSNVGPICDIVPFRKRYEARLSERSSVADMLTNNEWNWPKEWKFQFKEISKIDIPKLKKDVKDNTVWRDGNGIEGRFSTKKVWENFEENLPNVSWYKVIWFTQSNPRALFLVGSGYLWNPKRTLLRRLGWICKRVCVSDSVMHAQWVGNVVELEEPLLHFWLELWKCSCEAMVFGALGGQLRIVEMIIPSLWLVGKETKRIRVSEFYIELADIGQYFGVMVVCGDAVKLVKASFED